MNIHKIQNISLLKHIRLYLLVLLYMDYIRRIKSSLDTIYQGFVSKVLCDTMIFLNVTIPYNLRKIWDHGTTNNLHFTDASVFLSTWQLFWKKVQKLKLTDYQINFFLSSFSSHSKNNIWETKFSELRSISCSRKHYSSKHTEKVWIWILRSVSA